MCLWVFPPASTWIEKLTEASRRAKPATWRNQRLKSSAGEGGESRWIIRNIYVYISWLYHELSLLISGKKTGWWNIWWNAVISIHLDRMSHWICDKGSFLIKVYSAWIDQSKNPWWEKRMLLQHGNHKYFCRIGVARVVVTIEVPVRGPFPKKTNAQLILQWTWLRNCDSSMVILCIPYLNM